MSDRTRFIHDVIDLARDAATLYRSGCHDAAREVLGTAAHIAASFGPRPRSMSRILYFRKRLAVHYRTAVERGCEWPQLVAYRLLRQEVRSYPRGWMFSPASDAGRN